LILDLNFQKINNATLLIMSIVGVALLGILIPRGFTGNYFWPFEAIKKDRKELQISKDSLRNYGKKLVEHTAVYFGPNGQIAKINNGMNCQNCHLQGGTKEYGNNFFAVASTYPKYRERSGTIENVKKRINDCFERSLNGQPIDTNSIEMRALEVYVLSVGKEVPKSAIPKYFGIAKLKYLDRAANAKTGETIYQVKCFSCHGNNGDGVLNDAEFTYPPVWGLSSFNYGAGLFRLSNMAGFLKYNMPLGASFEKPLLSDEEAWDLAAFLVSKTRPMMDISKDWPDISKKPVDHPFGPFKDGFTEIQHKFGPFKAVADF